MDNEHQTTDDPAAAEQIDVAPPIAGGDEKQPTAQRRALVKRVLRRVHEAKDHHKDAFKRMEKDEEFCLLGADEDWKEKGHYIANITQRHVNQRVSALYAKNPTIVAKRRPRLDFAVWDETPQTLQAAFTDVQRATTAAQQFGAYGMAPPEGAGPNPQSMAVIQDFQAGTARRQASERVGKTLQILMNYFLQEQSPDFKTSMKQVVRRAETCGVAYIKVGFQREMQPNPEISAKINDYTAQIEHLQTLAKTAADGDLDTDDPRMEELRLGLVALQNAEMVVLREGLVFDFPGSRKIIVDPLCKHLRGFVGARWIAHELDLTPDEVEDVYGVKLKKGNYTSYDSKGGRTPTAEKIRAGAEDGDKVAPDLCRVWEVYDKPSGLVYTVADGHPDFLEEPAAPQVTVDSFWPLYAITFNEIEHEKEVYPRSDVFLVRDMQRDYNENRQGMREHKRFARPRLMGPKGRLSEDDKEKLASPEAYTLSEIDGMQPGDKVTDLIMSVPLPGVDPGLYETSTTFTDIQLTVGSSETQFGMASNATATANSLAAGAQTQTTGSNVDDLDQVLTAMARAGGQILLAEMSPEQVTKIVGPGAMWPELTAQDIAEEIFLEVAAGSTGQPNQAVEVANMEKLFPLLIQVQGINPEWLAREAVRRLGDNIDITEAISEGMPSIIALNAMAQPQQSPGNPANEPSAQGGQGAQNGPRGQEALGGTTAPMGNNQV